MIDYGKEAPAVQWVAKTRGPMDLEAIRIHAGGMAILVAPESERMIDHEHRSFFASSETDLVRAVAAHADSFRPANVF